MNHKKALSSARLIAAAILAALMLAACSPASTNQNTSAQQAEAADETSTEQPSEGAASSEEATETETTSEETASTETPSAGEGIEEEISAEEDSTGEQTSAEASEEELSSTETAASNDWQTDAPENHNMDPAVLADLHAVLPSSSVYSMVTVNDGVIIDEYYREGYDEQSLYRLNSASKSFTSALIGIAIEQGYIGGVDDLLSDYLPQVLEQEDTRKHQITLEHLLTHTSGLEWYEWGSGYSNWVEFQTAPNWVDYILGRNLVYDPGTQFAYSTGNTHLLSAVLEAATGMTEEEYARHQSL